MKKIKIFLTIITLGIISSSCVKHQPAPELPPPGSFVMDIDGMWKNSPEPVSYSGILPRSNFLFAASNIYWWNTVLTVQMFIPVAAFLESFNHEAVWDGTTKSWIWSYPWSLFNDFYEAELHGKVNNDEIEWSMYISKTDDYTDFLWFTGISKTDNSTGTWTINKDPEDNIKDPGNSLPFLNIQWDINPNGTSDITYTNIMEDSADNGNFIRYGKVDDTDLDAFYDIYKTWEDDLINIKWNTTTHYGRVLSMLHFTNPYWHCWDEFFENIACE